MSFAQVSGRFGGIDGQTDAVTTTPPSPKPGHPFNPRNGMLRRHNYGLLCRVAGVAHEL